ncbi:MAG: hypothetical protein AB1806_17975 [Acidobacteriota bacterium]
MNLAALATLAGGLPFFDLPLLVQAFDDPRPSLRVQLSRWIGQGKIIPLRRGLYTLGDIYRRTPLIPAVLANHLCAPSYLSGIWALSFHGLIPDAAVWLTSVTSRGPRRFENAVGTFDYRHIKLAGFFGYERVPQPGGAILVATPEKALVDHWYLTAGEWTGARLAEMRYQQTDLVSVDRLQACADRLRSPRVSRATKRWITLAAGEARAHDAGAVTL